MNCMIYFVSGNLLMVLISMYSNVSAIFWRYIIPNLVSCAFSTIPIFPPFRIFYLLVIIRILYVCRLEGTWLIIKFLLYLEKI